MSGCDVSLELGFRAEDDAVRVAVAARAPEELRLAAMLDGQVDLDGDLRVERLLAEGAAVEVMGVHVQQVLLELVRRCERFGTRGAAVLAPAAHEVAGQVGLQQLHIGHAELGRTVWAAVPAFAFRLSTLGAAQIRRETLVMMNGFTVRFDGELLRRRRAVEPEDVRQAMGGQGVLLEGGQVAESEAAKLAGVKEPGGRRRGR